MLSLRVSVIIENCVKQADQKGNTFILNILTSRGAVAILLEKVLKVTGGFPNKQLTGGSPTIEEEE